MKLILICLCISLVKSASLRQTYQISFDGSEVFPYAKLNGTIDRQLEDFTLCHWSKGNTISGLRAIFSYATKSTDNSILTFIRHNSLIHYNRNNMMNEIGINLPSTEWIHTCFTWSLMENAWQVFVNGKKQGHGKSETPLPPVEPNGIVILGQDQDNFGGGFQVAQSLNGRISEANLWDRILSPSEVLEVYNCKSQDGTVIGWNRVVWALFNGAKISPVHLPCGEPQ